jgi:hypothetical protein
LVVFKSRELFFRWKKLKKTYENKKFQDSTNNKYKEEGKRVRKRQKKCDKFGRVLPLYLYFSQKYSLKYFTNLCNFPNLGGNIARKKSLLTRNATYLNFFHYFSQQFPHQPIFRIFRIFRNWCTVVYKFKI